MCIVALWAEPPVAVVGSGYYFFFLLWPWGPFPQVGLDKLSSTKEVVATLQEELTVLQPQLVKTMKEVTIGTCDSNGAPLVLFLGLFPHLRRSIPLENTLFAKKLKVSATR